MLHTFTTLSQCKPGTTSDRVSSQTSGPVWLVVACAREKNEYNPNEYMGCKGLSWGLYKQCNSWLQRKETILNQQVGVKVINFTI